MEALNTEKPHIIHFSGHGHKSGELVFTSPSQKQEPISPDILKAIFNTAKENIKLIFLNACYSKIQAEAIGEEIDFVIGMNAPIFDDTATLLSSSFYNFLSSGITITQAFNQAKIMVEVRHPNEESIPELLIKKGVEDLKLIKKAENKKSNQTTINQNHNGDGDNVGGNKVINITQNGEKNIGNIEKIETFNMN